MTGAYIELKGQWPLATSRKPQESIDCSLVDANVRTLHDIHGKSAKPTMNAYSSLRPDVSVFTFLASGFCEQLLHHSKASNKI